MRKAKVLTAVLGMGLMFALYVPVAGASIGDEMTTVTFTMPVQIPGMVLPPGQYIFRFADPENSRTDLEVINAMTTKSYGIITGIPIYRTNPTQTAEFVLKTHKSGTDSLYEWLYPGLHEGLQFIYPKGK